MHSYHDVPPDDHEDDRLFKPPDALEEDETTSDIRRIIDWRNSYVPPYMTDFTAESGCYNGQYSFSFYSILFYDVPLSSSLFFQGLLIILSHSEPFYLLLFVMLTGTF
jgi:hypothetical protein